MNNFWQRTLTGAIFVVVMTGMVWLHAFTFLILLLTIVIIGTNELSRLINHAPVKAQPISPYLLGIIAIVAAFGVTYFQLPASMMLAIVPIAVGVLLYELYRSSERPFWNIAVTLFIPTYVALPFVFLTMIAFADGDYSPAMVLSFIGMIWMSDTGAYLAGVSFGRHRLMERISPKKTWEGFFGGFILALTAAWLLSGWLGVVETRDWMIISVIISITGTYGDLIESMLKRSGGVKDSGTIMPGHGGFLDRFDSTLISFPLVYLFISLLG